MKKKISISIFASVLLLSGCAERENAIFKKQVNNGFKISKNINISKNIKQISLKDQYIDFSIDKDLKSALKKLSDLDPDSVYLLKNPDQNIIFPDFSTEDSKKLDINSFYKLQQFVSQTTPYVLKLKTNPFRKGIKIVEIINKDAVKNDIIKYPFSVHGTVSLKSLLNEISKITGYNIIFENENIQSSENNSNNTPISAPSTTPTSVPTAQNTSNNAPAPMPIMPGTFPVFLQNNYISFTGKTIGEFLNYISNQFNYYVNIDYQNKLIVFKKYKTFSFPLLIPNIQMKTTTSLSKNSSSSTTSNDSLELDYTDNFIQNFINSLKNFLSDKGNIYYSSGVIYAQVTKNDYETISNMVNNFNDQFQKKAKLKVDIYVFLVNKTFNIGTDLKFKTQYINAVTNFLTTNVLSTSNIPKTSLQKSASLNLDNNFIRYVKHYSFNNNIINNIPLVDDLTTERNYIESIQTTTTTGTATSTSVQTNIGKIDQGQKIAIFPKIYSNKIFLRMLFKTSSLDNLEEKTIEGNTIMLPSISTKNIPVNINLRFGEKKIASIIQTFANANQFKGIVPLEGFIIGGNNQHQYVRELIAVVVSAEK